MALGLDHKSAISTVLDGQRLRLEDLPPPGTKRWVIRRKAEVVAGVRAGLISLEEACTRYTLSVEEFLSWQRSIDRHGMRGLRTTRLQDYRATPHRPDGSDEPGEG
ncbi:MAG TPA: DUF1153 domain-containing protein [Dongiaceae bacterium]|nr:DUF1153 domain-containing protein [Dongiaceae bacterium]